jgi:hypothetical protein
MSASPANRIPYQAQVGLVPVTNHVREHLNPSKSYTTADKLARPI